MDPSEEAPRGIKRPASSAESAPPSKRPLSDALGQKVSGMTGEKLSAKHAEDTYPYNTSHYKKWLWSDAEALRKERADTHETGCELVREAFKADRKPPEPLNIEHEGSARRYMLWFLLKELETSPYHFDFQLKCTSMAFFARYLIKNSPQLPGLDPRTIMYTCWILATKVDGVSLKIPPEALIKKGRTGIMDVCELEIPVLDATEFSFSVISPIGAWQLLMDDLFFAAKVPKEKYPEYMSELALNEHRMNVLYIGDVPFLYGPGEIATALVLSYPPKLVDRDLCYKIISDRHLKTKPDALARIKQCQIDISAELGSVPPMSDAAIDEILPEEGFNVPKRLLRSFHLEPCESMIEAVRSNNKIHQKYAKRLRLKEEDGGTDNAT